MPESFARRYIYVEFSRYVNPSCNCGIDIASFTHSLLRCALFLNERCTLMSNINKIDPEVSKLTLPSIKKKKSIWTLIF